MDAGFYEKALKEQGRRIKELEQAIELLQKEISLQERLIAALQKEKEMYKRHAEDYSNLIHHVLDDLR